MLEVSNLRVATEHKMLLGPVQFDVAAGGALVIMGETGAGKSLIAQAIMGSLPQELSSSGELVLNGKRVDNLEQHERQQLWGRHLALLPQEPWLALNPLMCSVDQVSEAYQLVAGHSRKESRAMARASFQSLGLQGSEALRPGELSGGMSQRVAFSAALAGGAPILLADEPTKGLDRLRSNQIVDLLNQTRLHDGVLLVITHDASVARAIGGEIMVLKNGVCIERGATTEVLTHPQHDYTRQLIAADPANWPAVSEISASGTVLEASDLDVGHGKKALIRSFDLVLSRRERVAVTGHSGVGKTTLLDTLAGLTRPMRGNVYRGENVGPTGVQKIYQDPPTAFAPKINLATSLKDVARLHRVDWDEIESLLEALSVDTTILQRRPNQVSGGELQRIAIARAISVKPAVLLADEPTSRLDPITQMQTMTLLAKASATADSSVVLVTHDEALASVWANRTIHITTEA